MAKNTIAYFTKDPIDAGASFTSADGTTAKTLLTPTSEGVRVDSLIISSSDTVSRTLLLQINNGTSTRKIGSVTIPAGSGTNGSVAAVSGLNRGNLPWIKIDANGNPYINLKSNQILEGKMLAAVSSSQQIDVTILGGDYTA